MLKQTGVPVVTSMNATCDSFYSSQARPERDFLDKNARLLEELRQRYPDVSTLDMETFQLFHLAKCIKNPEDRGIHASALKIIVANRPRDAFLIDEAKKRDLERKGGLACLNTLASFSSI